MGEPGFSSSGLWLCAIVSGYCFGCLSMAWFVGFLKGIDIKKSGNGNAGASNTLMVLGVVPGVVTAIWDIGKAGIAYLFMMVPFRGEPEMCVLAAGMAVVGHCFPFWLDFDGGKGFAPYIGFMICCDWKAALLPILLGLALGAAFDKIVAMTFTCVALWPVMMLFLSGPVQAVAAAVLSCLLLWRHRENIRKLKDGTEPGIRAAFRKEET